MERVIEEGRDEGKKGERKKGRKGGREGGKGKEGREKRKLIMSYYQSKKYF
jgi:ribosomal protein L15